MVIAILSGIFLGSSYFPHLAILLIPGLFFLFWVLDQLPGKKAKFQKFICLALPACLIPLYWIYLGMHNYLKIEVWQNIIATLFFSSLANIIFLSCLLLSFIVPTSWIKKPSVFFLFIFSMGSFVDPLFVPHQYSFQWASLDLLGAKSVYWLGSGGLHAATLIFAYFLYWGFTRSAKFFAVGAVFASIIQGLGYLSERQAFESASHENLRILAVQGQRNFLQFPVGKTVEIQRLRVFDQYFSMSHLALTENRTKKIDLIVWPESVFPETLSVDADQTSELGASPRLDSLRDFSKEQNIPILFGTMMNRADHYFNSALMIFPQATAVKLHQKKNLFPVGESFPFGLDIFSRFLGFKSYYYPGERQDVFGLNGISFNVQICYEVLFLKARDLSRDAKFIVNITNDMWFDSSVEAYQHLTMVRLKAMEFHMPIMRVANTGISAWIDSTGKVKASTEWAEALTAIFDIEI